jgi:hypothetical protein
MMQAIAKTFESSKKKLLAGTASALNGLPMRWPPQVDGHGFTIFLSPATFSPIPFLVMLCEKPMPKANATSAYAYSQISSSTVPTTTS